MSSSRVERLRRVAELLGRMTRTVEETMAQGGRGKKLHPTDLRCIAFLLREERHVTPGEINAFLGLTSGSGTSLLDRLETQGIVKRIRNPTDRRSVLVELDREGGKEQIKLVLQLQHRYRQALAPFSEEELDTIAEFLVRVSDVSSPESQTGSGR